MILGLALSVLFFQSQAPAQIAKGTWPDALGTGAIASHSPFVQRMIKAMERPGAVPAKVANLRPSAAPRSPTSNGSGGGNLTSGRYDVTDAAALEISRAHGRQNSMELQSCLKLASEGNLAKAEVRLESDIMNEPSELFAVPLLDLELERGDYIDAYKFASAFAASAAQGSRGVSGSFLLRASLAAASVGEVYAGQRDYVVGAITVGSTDGDIARMLPEGESPEVVAFLSGLAVGVDFACREFYRDAIPYLAAALKLDSGNAYASMVLAGCYADDVGLYSKAIRTLEAGLPRSGNGSVRGSMDLMLNVYRAALARVGDGKPAFPPPIQPRPKQVAP